MMSGGILGNLLAPDARRRIVDDTKAAVFGVIGPKEFFATLNPEENQQMLAAGAGVEPAEFPVVEEYFVGHVKRDVERDQVRERVWKIEADIVGRFPEEVTAEIERARSTSASPSRAEATKKTYVEDTRHYVAFCKALAVPPMPAEPAVLAAYILDGCKPSVLRRRLAALADWHAQSGRVMPKRHVLVRMAIRQAMKAIEAPPANSQPETERKADDGKA